MALRRFILFITISFYRNFKTRILSVLQKTNPTPGQIDFISGKLDIWGAATVVQAFVWQTGLTWINCLLIIASIIVCVILWVIAFVMKGYEK